MHLLQVRLSADNNMSAISFFDDIGYTEDKNHPLEVTVIKIMTTWECQLALLEKEVLTASISTTLYAWMGHGTTE